MGPENAAARLYYESGEASPKLTPVADVAIFDPAGATEWTTAGRAPSRPPMEQLARLVEEIGPRPLVVSETEENDEAPRSSEGALEDFIALADAPATDVLRFIKRRGILDIRPAQIETTDGSRRWTIERLDAYYLLAQQARALLRLSADLADGRPGRSEDWGAARFYEFHQIPGLAYGFQWEDTDPGLWRRPPTASYRRPDHETRQALVALQVSDWLEAAYAKPIMKWPMGQTPRIALGIEEFSYMHELYRWHIAQEGRPSPLLECHVTTHQHPSMLFTAVALQLARLVSSTKGLYVCSVCERPFEPAQRRPRSDKEGKFCSDGCRDEAHLRAMRDYYQRKKRSTRPMKDRAAKAGNPDVHETKGQPE